MNGFVEVHLLQHNSKGIFTQKVRHFVWQKLIYLLMLSSNLKYSHSVTTIPLRLDGYNGHNCYLYSAIIKVALFPRNYGKVTDMFECCCILVCEDLKHLGLLEWLNTCMQYTHTDGKCRKTERSLQPTIGPKHGVQC